MTPNPFDVSRAVRAYLRSRYGAGDLHWHPLYRATLDWFAWVYHGL